MKKIGLILMTYGSATTAPHVREYMDHIYRGKAPDGIVEDFEERYRLVGHSPLVEITEKQAVLLEEFLNNKSADRYVVRAGMLHSKPFIEEAMRDCKDAGAERCIGIILSPQFSSFIMDGYGKAFARAGEAAGFSADQLRVAGPWPTEPHFIRSLAERIQAARKKIQKEQVAKGNSVAGYWAAVSSVPVIFTTHSLPKRVVDKDPNYLEQLKATTDAVLKELGDGESAGKSGDDEDVTGEKMEWYSAYQSAGHTPEEWLKPDLTDILAKLKGLKGKAGEKGEQVAHASAAVLIVPIQFLTDHLEILYDLDIAARRQCDDFGIAYHRIELANTDPLFIEALGKVVKLY